MGIMAIPKMFVLLMGFHHFEYAGTNSRGGIPGMYGFPKGFQGFPHLGTFLGILGIRQLSVLLMVSHGFE